MRRPFGLGLRSQLVLSLLVAFVVTFALLSVVAVRLDPGDSHQEQQRRAENLAQSMGLYADLMSDGPMDAWISAMLKRGLAQSVQIQSTQGRLRSWGHPGDDKPDATWKATNGTTFRVWVPEVQPRNIVYRDLFLFYLGLTVAIVLLLTYALLTHFIVRPIDLLWRAAERLAMGRFRTSVDVHGAAEVALLGAMFNHMAVQLRQDRDALQHRLVELERTSTELAAMQEQLIRSQRLAAVGRLAAGVAHEVGNPLTAIRGLLDLLVVEDLTTEEQREFIVRVKWEVARIHRTIQNLLEFARHKPDPHGDEPSADLSDVVSDTLKLIDRQARFRDIDFVVSVDPDFPWVRGHPERVRQLLLNLLFNAADALEGPGRVEIGAKHRDGIVTLIVEDNGPGIDASVIDRVFEPFVTTKTAGRGTGLGLAVCHAIVERLEGTIAARNAEVRGAVFEVSLRAAP